jgi:hypothetical protein
MWSYFHYRRLYIYIARMGTVVERQGREFIIKMLAAKPVSLVNNIA